MTVIGGRGGRHDDWSSDHDRARARAAERLDGPLDADEAVWLDEHLASCGDCSAVAAEYAAAAARPASAPRPPARPAARSLGPHVRGASSARLATAHSNPRDARRRSGPYALLAGAWSWQSPSGH